MDPVRRSPFPGFEGVAFDPADLVSALTTRRHALGLSQTEVAARMGTSQSAVARLEAGGVDVRLSTLDRYAAALGHRLGWVASAAPPVDAGTDHP